MSSLFDHPSIAWMDSQVIMIATFKPYSQRKKQLPRKKRPRKLPPRRRLRRKKLPQKKKIVTARRRMNQNLRLVTIHCSVGDPTISHMFTTIYATGYVRWPP